MKRWLWASLISLGLLQANCGPLLAQLGNYTRPQVNPRPTVSPYLNMMNAGNPVTNYYGIVRPQVQTSQNIHQLQIQNQMIQENQIPMLGGSGMDQQNMVNQQNMLTTGHPVMFMNYAPYYPLLSRGANGGMGGLGNGTMGSNRR